MSDAPKAEVSNLAAEEDQDLKPGDNTPSLAEEIMAANGLFVGQLPPRLANFRRKLSSKLRRKLRRKISFVKLTPK